MASDTSVVHVIQMCIGTIPGPELLLHHCAKCMFITLHVLSKQSIF